MYNALPQSLLHSISISSQIEIILDVIDVLLTSQDVYKEELFYQTLKNSIINIIEENFIHKKVINNINIRIYQELGFLRSTSDISELFYSNSIELLTIFEILHETSVKWVFVLDPKSQLFCFTKSKISDFIWWSPLFSPLDSLFIASIVLNPTKLQSFTDQELFSNQNYPNPELHHLLESYYQNSEKPYSQIVPLVIQQLKEVKILFSDEISSYFKEQIQERNQLIHIQRFLSSNNLNNLILKIILSNKGKFNPEFLKTLFKTPDSNEINILKLIDSKIIDFLNIYPSLDKNSNKSREGAYYTPIDLTMQLIERTLGNYLLNNDILQEFHLFDPAMGTGILLIFALEWLAFYSLKSTSKKVSLLSLRSDILNSCISGNDYNKDSVKLGWILLNQFCGQEANESENYFSTIDIIEEFISKNSKLKNEFNVILSNPPYLALHSRFIKNIINKETQKILNERLGKYTGRRDNLYLYFLGICLDYFLKPRGLLGFVLDNSFFDLPSYKHVRKHLIENYSFKFLLINYDYRPKAIVDLGILVLKKTHPKDQNTLVFQYSQVSTCKIIRQMDFMKNLNYFFKYQEDPTLLSSVLKNSIPLGRIASIKCGLEYGKLLKTNFLSRYPLDPNWHPVIDGSHGLPDSFILFWVPDQPNSFCRFDKVYENELYENRQNYSPDGKRVLLISGDINRFLKPKLILRQSANRFICTLDENQYFSLRNTHIIYKIKQPYTLKFILGFLASSVATYLGHELNIIRSSGKNRYPQIRINDLKNLPIPIINPQNSKIMVELETAVELALESGKKISSFLERIWNTYEVEDVNKFNRQNTFLRFWLSSNANQFFGDLKRTNSHKYLQKQLFNEIEYLRRTRATIDSIIFNLYPKGKNFELELRKSY
ncbi:Eco57I restriction-modification methylase domain-containing protein [Candidatus Hodarchaeum mangrovi]